LVVAIGTGEQDMLSALLNKAYGQWKTFAPLGNTAACFSADGMQQVLAAALKSSKMDIFRRLWSLPAAAGLQGKQLGQLLHSAAATAPMPGFQGYSGAADGLTYLQLHPAWSSNGEADKRAWLLRRAVQEGTGCRPYLIEPDAPIVDVQLAGRLLQVAVFTHNSSNLRALLLLPACAKLDSGTVEQLLQSAVTAAVQASDDSASGCPHKWHSHHAAPSAAAGAASNVSRQQDNSSVLQAGERDTFGSKGSSRPADAASSWLSVFCQWDAAAGVPGWSLARIMKDAMQNAQGLATPPAPVMQRLCGSKAAARHQLSVGPEPPAGDGYCRQGCCQHAAAAAVPWCSTRHSFYPRVAAAESAHLLQSRHCQTTVQDS
jgi:hypothetical protein